MKKTLIWAVGLLLSPVLLFLILAALLYLPSVQNWAVDKVAAIASEKTGMQISVGTVSLEWPLNIGIDGFQAIDKGDTLADIGHLTADVRLWPLLEKQVIINELSLEKGKINTNGFISDINIKGQIGKLWLHSRGIDLDKETVEVNGARLADANLDITLSDTAAVDTTTSVVKWSINADSLSISRTAVALHLPGDTLHIRGYMGHTVAREVNVNLGTETYQVGSLDWHDGRLSYDDISETTANRGFDYNHIDLSRIRLGVDSIYYGVKGTSLHMRMLNLREKSGLAITEMQGGIKLDTAFTYVELPHMILRTPDSDIEAEAHVDFSVADSLNPGRMHVRLLAMLGKQDLMLLGGDLPQEMVNHYPNRPLRIQGSINGNLQHLRFTGFDIQLPTALHVKANGYASNITDMEQLRGQVELSGETRNLSFINTFLPNGYQLPSMTLKGTAQADRGRYHVDASVTEGEGSIHLDGHVNTKNMAYNVEASINKLNLRHFMPKDSLGLFTATLNANGQGTDILNSRSRMDAKATVTQLQFGHLDLTDITADATLNNGRALATITGHNPLFDGSLGIDALLDTKRLEANIMPQVLEADLYKMRFSEKPLTIGMDGALSILSDLNKSHEIKGQLSSLRITGKNKTYHPENIGILLRTNPDTTLVRLQSGDFIVKMDGSGGYEQILHQATLLTDSAMMQFNDKIIDQMAIKRLLPTMKLHVESKRENPVANILRTMDIDFKELFLDMNTSPVTGINGQMHLYSLNYDSTRIDTVRLFLKQRGERFSYQGQIRNNRRNPQFVFNALFDGHIHEHGALIGLRFYDDKNRMGLRLGATASMVDEGVRIQFMPERPTIGYKEFNLNKDNYILLGRHNHIQAKVDLISDDRTGMKLYTENQDSTMLQDLTLSLHQLDLGEITSVLPYLPQISGKLNGDYHIVQDQEERISVVSDMAVSNMSLEGSLIGNLSTELVYIQREDDTHAVEMHLLLDDQEFGMLQGDYKAQDKAINATFTMTHLPLSLVNGFVTDQIVGLDGYGEGELSIKGTTSRPIVDGEVYLDSAHLVSIPYGIRMRFDNDPVRVVGSHLLLENFGIYAYNEEPLNMQGDIDFSDLDNIQLNLRMRARNLQIINARQEPKSLAFGKAYVNLFALMRGPLDDLRVRGRLDVLGSTDLTYMLLDSPLSTDNRLDELVKFTDFTDTIMTATPDRPKPAGMDMDVTISVSQGAHFVCNLNAEQTNYVDLMGGGDLRMRYDDNGLSMTGRYTLANGEMKYSLPIVPLKTFTIQDGSYVEFTGDITNPRLNITATERTKTTVAHEGEQGRTVTFDCGVVITRTLNDMGLQFIISAPEDNSINSELQSMSVEERGKLAVTMLTTGMYLADGNTNSFSMNSALSSFLQSEINNITGSALKTLDLSVGLDNSTDAAGQSHTNYSFKFSKRFFNNRLKIQLGGLVSSGQTDANGQQKSFFDNVTMEYRLDQNSTKNIKIFYQQNIYDWLDGYTGLYGGGFVWRKKMNSLLDVFKIFSKDEQPAIRFRRNSEPEDSTKTVRP